MSRKQYDLKVNRIVIQEVYVAHLKTKQKTNKQNSFNYLFKLAIIIKISIAIFKTDNRKDLLYSRENLMLCDSLDGWDFGENEDMYMYG